MSGEVAGELRKADEVFSDCQVAIEVLCIGCPDERGWSFATDEREHGQPCEVMFNDVTNCERPVVMMLYGRPYCAVRYEKHDKPERELYERRMRGDWS